jgi:TonB family protein
MALRVGALGSLALHALAGAAIWLGAPPRAGDRPATTVAVAVVAESDQLVVARGQAPISPLGSADHSGASVSPAPRADLDVPDVRAAASGGGSAGASAVFTGRHDREELRAQMWNDPAAYRLPRTRTGRTRATPEALARLPDPTLDTSQRPDRRATLADRGSGGAAPTPASSAGRPMVEAGARAVEAARHGAASDVVDAAQASDERHPEAFDLTTPRAGGDQTGVAGAAPGVGVSAAADGRGDGATTLDVARGPGQPETRARLQDAYFRRLHARVLERVKWPPKLAIALEQGEVVVAFTLGRDGGVVEVRVARSSGFTEFDDAVVAAVRGAAPFGPVPAEVADGAGGVRVSAPFVFANPLIR